MSARWPSYHAPLSTNSRVLPDRRVNILELFTPVREPVEYGFRRQEVGAGRVESSPTVRAGERSAPPAPAAVSIGQNGQGRLGHPWGDQGYGATAISGFMTAPR